MRGQEWWEFPGAWIVGMFLAIGIALGGAWIINTLVDGSLAILPVIVVLVVLAIRHDTKEKRKKKNQSK